MYALCFLWVKYIDPVSLALFPGELRANLGKAIDDAGDGDGKVEAEDVLSLIGKFIDKVGDDDGILEVSDGVELAAYVLVLYGALSSLFAGWQVCY